MRRLLTTASCLALLLAGPAAYAAAGVGGGAAPSGAGATPREMGLAHFERGEQARRQALEALQRAQSAADEPAKQEARDEAATRFKRALRAYREATRADRKAFYAWNGMGFCQRMLGDDEAALKSYERALKIEPGFPQAIEYRGEAYLNLGRLEETKAAYLDLFGRERPLADLLLRKMQAWVAAARQNEQTPGAQAKLDAFAAWVDERAALAEDSASLAPAASVTDFASW